MEAPTVTVKLKRIFYLFNPVCWIPWSIFLALCLLWRGNNSIAVRTSLDFTLLALFIGALFTFPGSFSIENGTIRYTDHVRVRTFWISTGGVSVRVDYTVRRVRDVEFRQNFVERLFNVGHMRFCGSTSFDTKEKWEDRIPNRKKHVLYGIPHFDEFQEQLKELLKENAEIK